MECEYCGVRIGGFMAQAYGLAGVRENVHILCKGHQAEAMDLGFKLLMASKVRLQEGVV